MAARRLACLSVLGVALLPASASAFSLGPQRAVASHEGGFVGGASLTDGPRGRVLLAWSSLPTADATSQSWVRLLSERGVPVGPAINPTPSSGPAGPLAVAFDPAGRGWLAVWASGNELRGRRLAADARPTGPPVALAATGGSGFIRPLGLGRSRAGRFVLAYASAASGSAVIRTLLLSASLEVIADRPVATIAGSGALFTRGRLGFGRSGGLLAWTAPDSRNRDSIPSFLLRLDANGAAVGRRRSIGSSVFSIDPVGNRFLLGAEVNRRPWSPLVQMTGSPGRKLRSGAQLGGPASLGTRRGLALFTKGPGDADDVYARVIDREGRLIGGANQVSAMGGAQPDPVGPGSAEAPSLLAVNRGRDFLVAWTGHRIGDPAPRKIWARLVRP